MKYLKFGFILTALFFTTPLFAGSLTIQVAGISGISGEIRLALFNQSTGFPDETSRFRGDSALLSLKNATGNMTFILTGVKPGTYALAVYHDKNNNQQLDKNFLGFPKEPYGISNNIRARFGTPKFANAQFEMTAMDKTIKLSLD